MKSVLVCGAGGFIGGHLVSRLKEEGCYVVGVDLKNHAYKTSVANEFIVGDLRDKSLCERVLSKNYDEVYQLAADMGGAGFVFTGDNDADIMHNSALININMLDLCRERGIKRIFYSSSACMYPEHNQLDPENPMCSEESAYPANPDSEYGWEKLFSERLYLAYCRNYGMEVRIARYHNIYGPEGTWDGGREKAPAALCRKVSQAVSGGDIDIWGDGKQTRSFLFIDDCIEATIRLTRSDFTGPVNIGSEEIVTINELAAIVMQAANKKVYLNHISGPQGVRGRNSDNKLIEKKLGWKPAVDLKSGIKTTYEWIDRQVKAKKAATSC